MRGLIVAASESLSPRDFKVFVVLYSLYTDRHRFMMCNNTWLAKACNMGYKSVQRSVASLHAKGWIGQYRKRWWADGGYKSSRSIWLNWKTIKRAVDFSKAMAAVDREKKHESSSRMRGVASRNESPASQGY